MKKTTSSPAVGMSKKNAKGASRATVHNAALSFSWKDVAGDRPPAEFRQRHRFTGFLNRFLLAFGFDVLLDLGVVLEELRKGRGVTCRTLAERQFWLGLCLYAAKFEALARDPKVDRAEMERATDRAVVKVERFKTRFPDLCEDEAAFLGAFDLDLHDDLAVELGAPSFAVLEHDTPATPPEAANTATTKPRRPYTQWTTRDRDMAHDFLRDHPELPLTRTGAVDARAVRYADARGWDALYRMFKNWVETPSGSSWKRRANGLSIEGRETLGVKDGDDLESLLGCCHRTDSKEH